MKKLLILLAVLLVIQIIRPSKNNGDVVTNDISNEFQTPKEVQQIIKKSCADCHSNKTNYPWYSEIAPISWYVASNVSRGKKHLNFSEWTQYNKYQKEHIIKNLRYVITDYEMPLKSYLLKHPEAKISEEEYQILLNWIYTLQVN